MRRPGRLLALLVTGVAVAAVTACGDDHPQPTPFAGGNPLQPLADDMTWIYRPSADFVTDERMPVVMSVVGREEAGGETHWLVGQNVGETFATRAVVATRGDEVWTVAFDELLGGQWKRWTLDSPQLTQPPPGNREWAVDFSSGPELWRFLGTWKQRASGQMQVLGRSGPAWLAVGDLKPPGPGAGLTRETDTYVEGVGLVKFELVGEGFRARYDLVSVGTARAPLADELHGALGDLGLKLTTGAPPRLTIGEGAAQPINVLQLDGDQVRFEFDDPDGRRRQWNGRATPFGLLGTATGPDGASVVDFVNLLPE